LEIILAFCFVTLGAIAIGTAFEGYFLKKLRVWENVLLALSGICVFIPNPITRTAGLAFLGFFLLKQVLQARQEKPFEKNIPQGEN